MNERRTRSTSEVIAWAWWTSMQLLINDVAGWERIADDRARKDYGKRGYEEENDAWNQITQNPMDSANACMQMLRSLADGT
jgi:hypothetical protein